MQVKPTSLLELCQPKAQLPVMHKISDLVEEAIKQFPELLDGYEEHCVLICLNDSMQIVGGKTVSIGTDKFTIVEPRVIFRHAILTRGCDAIVLLHNHPTGDPLPSLPDLHATARIHEAGEVMGIPLVDHIVIGRDSKSFVPIRGLLNDAPPSLLEAIFGSRAGSNG